MITINFDFTTGNEISYLEGKEKKTDFTTNCLQFFSFDTPDNVIVRLKDGRYIDRDELLENTGEYTDKKIRKEHDIRKILVANGFSFRSPATGILSIGAIMVHGFEHTMLGDRYIPGDEALKEALNGKYVYTRDLTIFEKIRASGIVKDNPRLLHNLISNIHVINDKSCCLKRFIIHNAFYNGKCLTDYIGCTNEERCFMIDDPVDYFHNEQLEIDHNGPFPN